MNTDKTQKDKVARVHDKYLYFDDIKEVLPAKISGQDSVDFVKAFINNWIEKNLLLAQAEANLNEEQKDVSQQLEDYRTSLITYIYEKELVEQKLDTAVTEEEIEKYYNENSRNFELKDNIIKVLYVKVKKDAPNVKKVQNWYKSEKPEDKKLLSDYCHQFAENFYLDEDSWLLFDDLLKEIPIQTYNQEQFLQNNRLIEVQDSTSLYFVNIKGFKIKDSISPLSFEKDNIRNIILNKRKLNLINQMKESLYAEAQKKKDFEILK